MNLWVEAISYTTGIEREKWIFREDCTDTGLGGESNGYQHEHDILHCTKGETYLVMYN